MQKLTNKPLLPEQHGLVISYFGNSVAVEADDGQVFQCHLHRNQTLPVVGDEVIWQLEKGNTGTIVRIEPRRSVLARGNTRGDGQGKMKPIAANIDLILIVMAPVPIFTASLVDRYLIAAELLNIQPIIVVNKSDLLEPATREQTLAQLAIYKQIPYPVLLTSVYTKEGLTDLSHLLKGKSAVLVGPSGVGKSSIISVFCGEAIRTNEVSPKGTGKHTTTATRLYHLPENGCLIDSPGVRDFNLWPVDRNEILRGFREFQLYQNQCKFRDCQHMAEPGCQVQEAVANGKIHPERYASYQALIKQAKSKF